MKYFIDTEFLEGTQKKWFGETKPTIDLISIGIVAEDDREYYAISKDFNIKEAWNRYDKVINKHYPLGPEYNKIYWIRENVLKPIFIELRAKEVEEYNIAERRNVVLDFPTYSFCFIEFKRLIKKYGKSNKQIAEEIIEFCTVNESRGNGILEQVEGFKDTLNRTIEFYGYYSDYDWVVFCWLFGKMIDLPKGFPMYCIDLQQESDRIYNLKKEEYIKRGGKNFINKLSNHLDYPKQTNEHNALADAKWNFELYKFLKTL